MQTLGELKSATILDQLQFKVQFDIWPIIFFDAQNKITKDSKPSFWLKQKYCCVQLCKSRVVSGEVLSGTRVQALDSRVSLVCKCLPGKKAKFHRFCHRMNMWRLTSGTVALFALFYPFKSKMRIFWPLCGGTLLLQNQLLRKQTMIMPWDLSQTAPPMQNRRPPLQSVRNGCHGLARGACYSKEIH